MGPTGRTGKSENSHSSAAETRIRVLECYGGAFGEFGGQVADPN